MTKRDQEMKYFENGFRAQGQS